MLKLAACGLIAALALPAVAEAQSYGRHRDGYDRYERGHDRYGHGDRHDRGYGYGYSGGGVYVDSITETEHQAYIRQGVYADGYAYGPYGYGGYGYGQGGYGHGYGGGYYGHSGPHYGGHGSSYGHGYGRGYGYGYRHQTWSWRYDAYGRSYDGYRDQYGYNDDRPHARRGHDRGYYGREDCECGGVYLRDD